MNDNFNPENLPMDVIRERMYLIEGIIDSVQTESLIDEINNKLIGIISDYNIVVNKSTASDYLFMVSVYCNTTRNLVIRQGIRLYRIFSSTDTHLDPVKNILEDLGENDTFKKIKLRQFIHDK